MGTIFLRLMQIVQDFFFLDGTAAAADLAIGLMAIPREETIGLLLFLLILGIT